MNNKKKNNLKLSFGKKNNDIATPKKFYNELNSEFHFTFDPCKLGQHELIEKNPDKYDGLKIEWGDVNYVNPPYSEIKKWIEKAIQELKKGKKSVFLVTCRTSTKYWFDLIVPHASEIRFIEKGIQFSGYDKPFPMALCLIIFDPNKNNNNNKIIKKNTYQYFVLSSK